MTGWQCWQALKYLYLLRQDAQSCERMTSNYCHFNLVREVAVHSNFEQAVGIDSSSSPWATLPPAWHILEIEHYLCIFPGVKASTGDIQPSVTGKYCISLGMSSKTCCRLIYMCQLIYTWIHLKRAVKDAFIFKAQWSSSWSHMIKN